MKRVNNDEDNDDNVSSVSSKRLKLSNTETEVKIKIEEPLQLRVPKFSQPQTEKPEEDFPELSEKGIGIHMSPTFILFNLIFFFCAHRNQRARFKLSSCYRKQRYWL